ncbi:uncharacterized protein HLK63_D03707 [Nakaseomyces glabratus]|nr:tRNA synthetase class II core domain (G, H, P, S and T) [Nakaseomyces glabratus]KAI8399583.1 tRNA synthetase class II core domain (G, H, P, S and T) [Nakaseomyces glabratus]KAJ9569758.1 threonyl-tRNA synthetase [Nakaseomyces glabratus]OXB44679.1 hypothetical protein B1J91_D03542g [Nakaseomyces glabratus]OXB49978.1 hypothetical protein B1J92_D03542g [Nakaseomyces glabratus]
MLCNSVGRIPVKPVANSVVLIRANSKLAKKDSDSRLTLLQEVSNRQRLFITDQITPGSAFFLPNGTKIYNKLVSFMKTQQKHLFGFKEVITPLIYRKSLWEQSGHWENYKEDMFRVEGNDLTKEEYGLKPMNCPGHCVIFNRFDHSYNDLPIRYSDFSPLHRNEASGALSGLTRVRMFHQDDGHIFCTPDQVEVEILNCLKLVDMCYTKVFPISGEQSKSKDSYEIHLSTRPEHYIGELESWDHAEEVLRSVLEKSNKPWKLNAGDGAFYGPKLDIMVKDHHGKQHQVATIQLDFQLPQRFNLRYKDRDNSYKRPIMIHRAVLGSVERFMAMLVESNGGKWPFWLNPNQAIVIPLNTNNEEQVKMAKQLHDKLRGKIEIEDNLKPVPISHVSYNADIDIRAEPVGYRIKDAITKNYSYLIIVGDNEVKAQKFSVRTRENRTPVLMDTNEILEKFKDLESNYK